MKKQLTAYIDSPEALKKLDYAQMQQLAEQLRTELIGHVSANGGHLASNLGMVELSIALHYVFDCPEDKLVFDVGHQSYVHKMLTGRRKQMATLRHSGGLSGFPDTDESEYDCFTAGHASTSISAALGMARARDLMGGAENIVAVVGDGSLGGGLCYEALNDAGQSKTRIIVILNDNEMAISRNVGAMSRYLYGLRSSGGYRAFKRGVRNALEKIPPVGPRLFHFIEKSKEAIKSLFIDGAFFEALGFAYVGPVDGQNIKQLVKVLRNVRNSNRPVLVHVVTQKGHGYKPAENQPERFHGVAPFYVDSGARKNTEETLPACGEVLVKELCECAANDIRINVITAAMTDGTGMTAFSRQYRERFFDVGIAEEHALVMAAGMAASGLRPFVAMYSTFLQRGYDQILNEICRPNLPVTLLIDHAGFVGADGRTHQGLFDLSFLRSMPNMTILVPRDVHELRHAIEFGLQHKGPLAIRYPKLLPDLGEPYICRTPLRQGEWELLNEGTDAMIFACGPMVQHALQTAVKLHEYGLCAGVVDARFVKPIDEHLLCNCAGHVRLLVSLEENSCIGGLGEAIAHAKSSLNIGTELLILGAEDAFVPHGEIRQQREWNGLSVDKISKRIAQKLGL